MWILKRRKTVEDFKSAAFPHMDMLYEYALKMVKDPDLAAHLLEVTYVDAHRAWQNRQSRTDIRTFMFRTMRNRITQHRTTLLQDIGMPLEPTVDSELGLLPEECATVLILRDIQGHSYETISKLMEQSVESIGHLLHSARTLVRTKLRELDITYASPTSRISRIGRKSIPLAPDSLHEDVIM